MPVEILPRADELAFMSSEREVRPPSRWKEWKPSVPVPPPSKLEDIAYAHFRGFWSGEPDPRVYEVWVSQTLWKEFGINMIELNAMPFRKVQTLLKIVGAKARAKSDAAQETPKQPTPTGFGKNVKVQTLLKMG